MIFLLDQGLPRSTVRLLAERGIESRHVGDEGLATASDKEILDRALASGETVVTLDADFHAILAVSGADRPSVVRVRLQGLKAESLTELLEIVVERCGTDLEHGSVVSVDEHRIRVKRLPL